MFARLAVRDHDLISSAFGLSDHSERDRITFAGHARSLSKIGIRHRVERSGELGGAQGSFSHEGYRISANT